MLYRGEKPGIITSVALINKNYLAINNINRTIYIYNLGSNQDTKLLDKLASYIYGNYIKSSIRIRYDDLIKDKEAGFYESDFKSKGSILSGEEEGINLKVISYSGYAFKIKIGFLKNDYEVVTKEKIAEYKDEVEHESITLSNADEKFYSSYNSIFDKEKSTSKSEK